MAFLDPATKLELWHKWNALYNRLGPAVKRTLFSFIVGLITALCWAALPLGTKLDQAFLSQAFLLRGPLPPPDDIVVIGIDDVTFQELHLSPRWPFPRSYFATALERIVAAKPKLIILDLAAFEENNDKDANERIEAALKRAPTIMAKGFVPEDAVHGKGDTITLLSDAKFRNAVTTELGMFLQMNAGTIWNLSATVHRTNDIEKHFPLRTPLQRFARVNDQIPGVRSLINFYGPEGQLHKRSLFEFAVDGGDANAAALTDKIVFIGFHSMARGRGQQYQDEFAVTAPKGQMFGVEIHATIAANLVEGNWIRRLSIDNELTLIFLSVFFMLMVFLVLPLQWGWLVVVSTLTLWAVTAYACIIRFNLFLSGFYFMVLGIVLTLGPLTVIRSLEERRRRIDIEEAISGQKVAKSKKT